MAKGKTVKNGGLRKESIEHIKSSYIDDFLEKYFGGRELYLLTGLILLICFCTLFSYLTFQKVLLFKGIGSDSINAYYCDYIQSADYIRNTGVPYWSFYQGLGQNIFPGGLSNPFDIILFLFGRNYLSYALVYVEVLKILVNGILIFLYFRTIPLSRYASVCGSLIYSFSGYIILSGSGWFELSTSVVYGTFLLLSFEKLYKENNLYLFPLAVFLLASNFPFYLYLFGVFLVLYAHMRIFDECGFDWKKVFSISMKMLLLTILGLLISSLFLFNRISIMIDSPRGSGATGYSDYLKSVDTFATGTSEYYLTMLFRFFSNDILGTGIHFKGWRNYLEAPVFYSGLVSLLLLPQIFFIKNVKYKRVLISAFILFWIIMLIFPYFRYSYYLFSGDYFRGGLDFVISLAIIIGSIYSLNDIYKTGRINIILLFSTAAILLILLYGLNFENDSTINADLRNIIAFIIVCNTFVLFSFKFNTIKPYTKIVLLILITSESGYFTYITYNNRIVKMSSDYKRKVGLMDYSNDAVNYIKSIDSSFYRIYKDYTSGTAVHASINDAKVQGFFGLSSYSSYNQKYFIRFLSETKTINLANEKETRWATGLLSFPLLHYITNVRYYLTKKDTNRMANLGYQYVNKIGNVTIYRNPNELPLGFTYDKIMKYDDFNKLDTFKRQMTFFKYCVIEDEDIPSFNNFHLYDTFDSLLFNDKLSLDTIAFHISELKKDTLNITKFSQNKITGNIELSQPKILFFSIPYDKGWIAKVDGEKVHTFITNLGFTGLLINPGKHNVELSFMPVNFFLGMYLSVFALFIYIAMIIISIFRKRKISR